MAHTFRVAAIAGALFTTTLLSAPAAAAGPMQAPAYGAGSAVFDHSRFDPVSATADWRCRWNCGWGRGWGRGGGWGGGWGRGWRRNRIDAGDVILGAVIIGGIAAIANSENRRRRDRDVVIVERDPDDRDRNWRGERRGGANGSGAGGATSGLDNAAAMCVDAVERGARVGTVDNVARNASGWDITGALTDGSGFRCRIGNDGRIDGIEYGAGFASGAPLGSAESQWSDDAYASARGALGGTVRPDIAVQEARVDAARRPGLAASAPLSDRMPAYPGGPIPGETIPENAPEPEGAF